MRSDDEIVTVWRQSAVFGAIEHGGGNRLTRHYMVSLLLHDDASHTVLGPW